MIILRRLWPSSLEEAATLRSASGVRRYLRGKYNHEELNRAFLAAVKVRSLDLTRLLFEHGADINARDTEGNSALHISCQWPSPQYDTVQWLLANGSDVNASDNTGLTPSTGYTPLFEAALAYDNILTVLLLNAGANVNALTLGGTALHAACKSAFKHQDSIFRKYSGNVITTLLEWGADVNLSDPLEQKSPLHFVADYSFGGDILEERYLAVVTRLLTFDANPFAKDKDNNTPLDYAMKWGHHAIAAVLQQAQEKKGEYLREEE